MSIPAYQQIISVDTVKLKSSGNLKGNLKEEKKLCKGHVMESCLQNCRFYFKIAT